MSRDIREQIGERIKEARERLNLTQLELAKRLNRTQTTVSCYENGTRTIKITELPELAKALDVQLAYFFGEEHAGDEILSLINQLTPPFRAGVLILARQQLELQKRLQEVFGHASEEDLKEAAGFVMSSEEEIRREANEFFYEELVKRGFLIGAKKTDAMD